MGGAGPGSARSQIPMQWSWYLASLGLGGVRDRASSFRGGGSSSSHKTARNDATGCLPPTATQYAKHTADDSGEGRWHRRDRAVVDRHLRRRAFLLFDLALPLLGRAEQDGGNNQKQGLVPA